MSVTLQGEVERVTFENEETGFRVLRLGQVDGWGSRRHATVVGILPAVGPGTRVRVNGRVEEDPRHGERVRAESCVVVELDTLTGLEKYLGSGVIPGLGPALAKRVVKYFGLETLSVLDGASHRLSEVPGLGRVKVEDFRRAWGEQRELNNVMLVLQTHGVSPALGMRIVKQLGEKAAQIVQQNPYRLAMEVAGVGFKTADRIAKAQGISGSHPERAQAYVLHELRALSEQGHCFCPRVLLEERTALALDVETPHVAAAIDALWAKEWLVVEEDRVFLEKLHKAELRVVEHLKRLRAAPSHPVQRVEALLEQFEVKRELSLAEAQRRAVFAAADEKCVVITGGPGVGKTTIVQAILTVLSRESTRVHLAAPTGRAAKRLAESTGKKATTLHRLLEVDARTGQFQKNAESPLESDLLIVDEASMIDVVLMAHLLEAIPSATRLVLVGDSDQLPSVGPGSVLRDIVESQSLPVVRLEVIFRQAGQSGIIENSRRILAGELPVGSKDPDGDFFWIQTRDPHKAAELVRQVVTERLPSRFGLTPKTEIQVLTPMHRGEVGTVALNELLQKTLNAGGVGLGRGEPRLLSGDKVMQLKNDYEKDVFNGDLGEIVRIEEDTSTWVVAYETEEGAREVRYTQKELSQLSLAYATTIHKSQGSEYPAVVIPLFSQHFVMLSRHLLYTAVTRAKRVCVLIAEPKAIELALAETRREERQTRLSARLRE